MTRRHLHIYICCAIACCAESTPVDMPWHSAIVGDTTVRFLGKVLSTCRVQQIPLSRSFCSELLLDKPDLLACTSQRRVNCHTHLISLTTAQPSIFSSYIWSYIGLPQVQQPI
ncbi:hypothetical protein C8Q79DRAFT_134109 [Trametes meyenii]|nr:hypothetical protein C8Q79DRAFT_134109 [Trametes meyenii]